LISEFSDMLLAWLPSNIDKPARILLIFVMTWLALRAVHRVIPKLREVVTAHQDNREDSQRIITLSRVIRYFLTVIIFVVAGLLLLSEFGISVAPILGAAGVVGIAVGFGAQSLVKDYFTGFFLLLENQIRIGDVVDAAGKAGLVEELTLRYLRLRDYSGNVHFIPNGNISVVTNMSLGFAQAVVDVSIAYGEDVDHAVAVIRTVGQEMRDDSVFSNKILDNLEIAGVDEWADSAIMIRCRFRVAPLEQWNVRRELLRRLLRAFDKAGIEIPYPHLKIVYEPTNAPARNGK
jgi:moderate conductance mechanosensitive channel